ncbi:MAG: HEPN domain protein [Syntrophaceae bacterium PtaB.Bin038]|nr:MAG: HEPN domain protein [Syntrophaceae bacterium PtaB.Bin038]
MKKAITYWRDEAKEALQVSEHLFEKRDYSYALFFGHLAVEKILKALYVAKKNEQAPPIHNLVRLAEAAEIALEEPRKDALIKITTFNLEARYPDETRSFRKKCTEDFTRAELENITEVFQWLSRLIP